MKALPLAAVGALALCFFLALWRTAPPSAKPASAPPDQFSAERAADALRRILPEGTPHPMGSPEQRRVRERIESRLRELGWTVKVQRAPVCSSYGACGVVENILAELGTPRGARLVLAAHYDSVPAGPGASDDGLGVATLLEVARALAHQRSNQPVLLLFTDGEEAGLLGAEAFVRENTLELDTVVNIEARGTSGASLLFETSGGNSWPLWAFARAAERPVTSSLFPAVYARLPNDTDLSVFRRAGVRGLNFANIGGVGRYHTPTDDLAHLSLRTLQHHGDHALGLTEWFVGIPRDDRNALFFDVLGLGVVRMPLSVGIWLQAAATLLWGVALTRAFRAGARATRLLKSLGVWPFVFALGALSSFGMGALFRAVGALGSGWPAHPEPFFLALAALLAALALAALALVDTGTQELWLALWTWFGLAGWVAHVVLPEAGFLFFVPWLVAAITPGPHAVRVLASAVAAALLWLPVLLLSYDALGLSVPALFAAAALLGLGGFWPALAELRPRARRYWLRYAAAVAVGCCAVGVFLPPFSEANPQRLSLALHLDSDAGRARWLVDASSGPVPRSLLDAGRFAPEVVDSAPTFVGWRPDALAAPAPAPELSAPMLEPLSQGRLRVRSTRGATTLSLQLAPEPGVTRVRFQGQPAPLRGLSLTLLGVGPEGTEIELEGAASLVLADHSPGLPPYAAALLAARPRWASPSQAGDETVVSRSFRLGR